MSHRWASVKRQWVDDESERTVSVWAIGDKIRMRLSECEGMWWSGQVNWRHWLPISLCAHVFLPSLCVLLNVLWWTIPDMFCLGQWVTVNGDIGWYSRKICCELRRLWGVLSGNHQDDRGPVDWTEWSVYDIIYDYEVCWRVSHYIGGLP